MNLKVLTEQHSGNSFRLTIAVESNEIPVIVTAHEINEIIDYLQLQSKDDDTCVITSLASLPQYAQLLLILNNFTDWKPSIFDAVASCIAALSNQPPISLPENLRVHLLIQLVKMTFAQLSPESHASTINDLRAMIDDSSINDEHLFILKTRLNILLSQLLFSTRSYEESLELLTKVISSLEKQSSTATVATESSWIRFHLFNCYVNSSEGLNRISHHKLSLSNLSKARQLIPTLFVAKEERNLYMTIVDLNIANIAQDQNRNEDAIDTLRSCLKSLSSIAEPLCIFASRALRLSAQVHNNLSTCLSATEQFDVSLKHALQSLKLNENYFGVNSTSSELAKNLVNVAQIYGALELTDQAAAHALKAEKIFQAIGDTYSHAVCLGSIAAIFSGESASEMKKARGYLERCIGLFESISVGGESLDYLTALLSYSRVLFQQKEHKLSIEMASKTLKITKDSYVDIQTACFEQISEAHRESGNLDESIDNLYDAIAIYEKAKRQDEQLLLAYSNMAVMWQEKEDQTESAYYLGKANQLEQLLNAAAD